MLLANFNGKEHLRHRAVSLRQHGFLVIVCVCENQWHIQCWLLWTLVVSNLHGLFSSYNEVNVRLTYGKIRCAYCRYVIGKTLEHWQKCVNGRVWGGTGRLRRQEARRRTVKSIPASGPRCHIGDRICSCEFRLWGHLRSHHPHWPSTASSSLASDIIKQAMFNKKSDKLQGLVACDPLINDGVSGSTVGRFLYVVLTYSVRLLLQSCWQLSSWAWLWAAPWEPWCCSQ